MNIRTLVICGDSWHPAETIVRGLSPLANAGFDFEFLDDGANWTINKLDQFFVIVLAKANMISATDDRAWLTPDLDAAFQNHLRLGGGLLVIHGGTSRYDKLPLMRHATGGAFVSHPPQCAVTLEPKPSHQLSRGLEALTVRDEHYFMTFEGSEADVFLHSRSEHGIQPAGWTRSEGLGRVCVLTPGHNLEVWLHPEFQKLLSNALYWTAKLN
jgi:type 1 glutamine amidotransferase